MSWIGRVAVAVAALAGASCTFVGPSAVRATRTDYNQAIVDTRNQELLLNLVRLRYRDTPFFMTVERVASALTFSRSASLGADLESGASTASAGASMLFSESPTIFYVPVEGDRFVREIMAPISLDFVLLLYHSGWSVERILALTVQEANGLKNAPTASGPTPVAEPEFRDFRQAIRVLRALQLKGLVELGRTTVDDVATLELKLLPGSADDPDARTLRTLLGLAPDVDVYPMVLGVGGHDRRTIVLKPRSLIGVMFLLSQSVDVPERDLEAGVVTRTLRADGTPFDWTELFDGLFAVHSAADRPASAAVAVEYRGAWFYLPDDDLDAKSTFVLLTQLLALQAGQTSAPPTLLSFSVGR